MKAPIINQMEQLIFLSFLYTCNSLVFCEVYIGFKKFISQKRKTLATGSKHNIRAHDYVYNVD